MSGGNDVAMETLVLTHEGLILTTNSPPISIAAGAAFTRSGADGA